MRAYFDFARRFPVRYRFLLEVSRRGRRDDRPAGHDLSRAPPMVVPEAERRLVAGGRRRRDRATDFIRPAVPCKTARALLSILINRNRPSPSTWQTVTETRRTLSRRSRNQKGVRRLSNNQPRLSRAVLDDPPIHIRPNCSRQSGCKGKNPLDSSHDGPTILPKNISAATPICAKNITESVRKGLNRRQRPHDRMHGATI